MKRLFDSERAERALQALRDGDASEVDVHRLDSPRALLARNFDRDSDFADLSPLERARAFKTRLLSMERDALANLAYHEALESGEVAAHLEALDKPEGLAQFYRGELLSVLADLERNAVHLVKTVELDSFWQDKLGAEHEGPLGDGSGKEEMCAAVEAYEKAFAAGIVESFYRAICLHRELEDYEAVKQWFGIGLEFDYFAEDELVGFIQGVFSRDRFLVEGFDLLEMAIRAGRTEVIGIPYGNFWSEAVLSFNDPRMNAEAVQERLERLAHLISQALN